MAVQASLAGARWTGAASPAEDRVTVRPWRRGDEQLVRSAEARISPMSFYARFFMGGDRFPAHYVERLAQNLTVVAVVGAAAVGWAEIAPCDLPGTGELGVLVVDDWQHRRLGPRLVTEALRLARGHGISVVTADVMDTNRPARRALARMFGEHLTTTHEDDVLHYVLPLVPLPSGPTLERRPT
jgi:GNAT superfamily N-acetyltransferase